MLILVIAVCMNLVSNYIIKKRVDVKAERMVRAEYNAVMKEYREALSSGDQARIDRAKKRQKVAQEMMMKQSSVRMKSTFYFLLPFTLVYFAASYVIGFGTHTAISPYAFDLYLVRSSVPMGGYYAMDLITWWIVVSFASNLIIARAMGTST